jgi:hypothetical protein
MGGPTAAEVGVVDYLVNYYWDNNVRDATTQNQSLANIQLGLEQCARA